MALFPWSFCVCPNAGLPVTHIGHVWSFAHSRWLYDMVKTTGALQYPAMLDVRWNLAFDHGAKADCESVYLDLLAWMGMPPDAIHHTADWLALTNTKRPESWGRPFVTRLCAMPDWLTPTEHNSQPYLYKIVYFNATNVYWHMRGMEHVGSQLRIVEEVAAQYLAPLRLPLMFYHPVLKDEAGAKIDAAKLDPAYALTPDVRARPAHSVLCAVLRGMGQKSVSNVPSVPMDKALVGQIGQFYVYDAGRYFHALANADLRVSSKWKEFLE